MWTYRASRMLNSLFGALTVWWVCLAVRRLKLPAETALLVIGLWATTAEATFMAGVIGNDFLATAFCALAFLYLARHSETDGIRDCLIASVAFGLAVMTKMTAALVWVPAVLVILWSRKPSRFLRAAILAIVPILISGWSIWRSMGMHPRRLIAERVVGIHDGTWLFAKSWLLAAVKSAYVSVLSGVGVIGTGSIFLPGWLYGLYIGFLFIVLVAIWRSIAVNGFTVFPKVVLPSWAALAMLYFLSIHWFRQSGETMSSRLYFPYLPGVLATAVVGLGTFQGTESRKPRKISAGFMLALAILLVIAGFLPAAFWSQVAVSAVTWAKFGMPATFYAGMVSRLLTAAGVSILVVVGWNAGETIRREIPNAKRGAYVLLGSLIVLNLLVLFAYVRPFYA
jgi:hypothetical protein